MSRSGYSDACEGWALIRWRGAVNSAIRGKRGQALLRELAEAMDAMPVKELIVNELQVDGHFCALGVVAAKRGLDVADIDPEDRDTIANTFNIATALAAEIMEVNDRSMYYDDAPDDKAEREKRWRRVRIWVGNRLRKENEC